jgi:hypothetical protein
LRKDRIRADADDFRVDILEFVVIVPTGRQFLDSSRGEIEHIKLDEDVFASAKAAELELAAPSTGQLELRSFVADFDCENSRRYGEREQEEENESCPPAVMRH